MNKGERTKLEILNQGMKYSCRYGLAEVTIGNMAKECNLSRTGVISHFSNKEDMQISILKHSEQIFIERVITPARDEDPLTHLKNFLNNWANWTNEIYKEYHFNCPFLKAVVEFESLPESNVKRYVIDQQSRLMSYLNRRVSRCIESGIFSNKVPAEEIGYELYSLYLGHAIAKRVIPIDTANDMFDTSLTRLFGNYGS